MGGEMVSNHFPSGPLRSPCSTPFYKGPAPKPIPQPPTVPPTPPFGTVHLHRVCQLRSLSCNRRVGRREVQGRGAVWSWAE